MDKQKRDAELIRKLLQLRDLLIIVGVGDVRRIASHQLERVDDNESGVRMLTDEFIDLLAQTICQRFCSNSEESIPRDFIRDGKQTLLHTPQRILQAEVQRCALLCRQVPDGFALCNADAQIQHQPRLADLRCATEDRHALRQQCCDAEFRWRQIHLCQCFAVNDGELFFCHVQYPP